MIKSTISWLASLWIAKTLLISLTYKFTGAPVTIYIFNTVGQWMSDTIAQPIGSLFSKYGAYTIGTGELTISLLLLAPALFWILNKAKLSRKANQASFHSAGGILSVAIIAGAIFSHLATPLGIEIFYQGQGDGGSLFYSSIMVFLLGSLLFFINGRKFIPEFE